jgi:hypothetical protein
MVQVFGPEMLSHLKPNRSLPLRGEYRRPCTTIGSSPAKELRYWGLVSRFNSRVSYPSEALILLNTVPMAVVT